MKAQGMNEMQCRIRHQAGAADGPGVVGDFGPVEDDVHGFHGDMISWYNRR